MAVLTPDQVAALIQIIRDGSTAVAIATTGYDASSAEVERLKREGYLPADLDPGIVKDSFALGQLMQQQASAKSMSYREFTAYLAKNPIALSPAEQAAQGIALARAGTFAVGLGNVYSSELGRVVVNADASLAAATRKVIQDETAFAIQERKTVGELRTRLRQMTGDWSRDWDRIAATETQLAHQEGFLHSVTERYGDEELLAKLPEPGACEQCKKHYLEDGKPIIRPASWWHDHGSSNVGRKQADWQPVLGAMHPFCRCQLIRVPAGWGFDEDGDLVPLDDEAEKSWIAESATQEEWLAKAEQLGLFAQRGPFIGPRGGKWADPQHKIPWKERKQRKPKKPEIEDPELVVARFGGKLIGPMEPISHKREDGYSVAADFPDKKSARKFADFVKATTGKSTNISNSTLVFAVLPADPKKPFVGKPAPLDIEKPKEVKVLGKIPIKLPDLDKHINDWAKGEGKGFNTEALGVPETARFDPEEYRGSLSVTQIGHLNNLLFAMSERGPAAVLDKVAKHIVAMFGSKKRPTNVRFELIQGPFSGLYRSSETYGRAGIVIGPRGAMNLHNISRPLADTPEEHASAVDALGVLVHEAMHAASQDHISEADDWAVRPNAGLEEATTELLAQVVSPKYGKLLGLRDPGDWPLFKMQKTEYGGWKARTERITAYPGYVHRFADVVTVVDGLRNMPDAELSDHIAGRAWEIKAQRQEAARGVTRPIDNRYGVLARTFMERIGVAKILSKRKVAKTVSDEAMDEIIHGQMMAAIRDYMSGASPFAEKHQQSPAFLEAALTHAANNWVGPYSGFKRPTKKRMKKTFKPEPIHAGAAA